VDEATLSLPVTAPGTTRHLVDTPSFQAVLEVEVTEE